MKKILPCSEKTLKYLKSLPKIYLIGFWAKYGIVEFPFAGKCDEKGIPYIYQFDDHNGTCENYFLRKLTDTTTGFIYAWTINKSRAEQIAEALNKMEGNKYEH